MPSICFAHPPSGEIYLIEKAGLVRQQPEKQPIRQPKRQSSRKKFQKKLDKQI
jgi:hypothetical protein